MIFSLLLAIASAQELAPVAPVQTAHDFWGVGGGGLAGLVSAVLALTVKDKLLSQREPAAAADSATISEMQTRVTRLELQHEALRDTQRDLRQLPETLGQLIRDLASKT